MAVIYKLTREDGLEYIGITLNLPKRLSSHRRSKRFEKMSIINVQILFEGEYDQCYEKEEEFIIKYNTFKKGLNMTNKGKGKNDTDKFSTYGYKFSEESKFKMSQSARNRTDRPKGYTHSESTKLKWSAKRKGKIWGTVKIDKNKILNEWHSYNPSVTDMEYLIFKKDSEGNLFFKNGRKFSYIKGKLILFKDIKSKEYGVTPEAIKRIIKK